jgi:hypothetical protein
VLALNRDADGDLEVKVFNDMYCMKTEKCKHKILRVIKYMVLKFYKTMVVPTLVCGSEVLVMTEQGKRIKAAEVKTIVTTGRAHCVTRCIL